MKIVLNAVRAYKNPRFYFFDKALSCLAKVLYSKKKPHNFKQETAVTPAVSPTTGTSDIIKLVAWQCNCQ